jgi:hypothetical protein
VPGDPGGPERDDDDAGPRGDEPAWMRLIAPLRSEDAAFRMVLWVAGVFLVLAAVVLLVRAIG